MIENGYIQNYNIGYVLLWTNIMERKKAAVLIAAYGLCHPDWSIGVMMEQMKRTHKIEVIVFYFGDQKISWGHEAPSEGS